jgi:steroid Delta-isomerase
MSTRSENLETLRTYYTALRTLDVDSAVKTFAQDAEMHCPIGEPPNMGQDGVRNFFVSVIEHFEAIAVTEEFMHCLEESAAAKWRCSGISTSGRTVEFEGVDLFHFTPEGKIRTLHAYWDPTALLSAIGD